MSFIQKIYNNISLLLKRLSPKQTAFFASAITVLLSLTIIAVLFFLEIPLLISIVVFSLLLLAISFIVVNFFINQFIYSKIKIIYKNIYDFKVSKATLSQKINNQNALDETRQEVNQWIESQNKEIEFLKKQEAYRREFLGNVAHELKTPIFNIQGYVLTLLDGGLDDKRINKDYLMRCEKSIDRMIAIVNDLDVINRLEVREMKPKIEKFDIIGLCYEVVEFLEIKAKQCKVKLQINAEENSKRWVLADKEQIRQVFTNLIQNGINYSKPVNDSFVHIDFYDMDENYLIEVKDNGIGIPKETIPRLFERFFRYDKTRSREHSGTGLGLAIVKHILEAHRQTINVRSTLGEGTTFGFTLKKA